jgi:hyperosmotically inducible periplasmic protein
MRTLQLCGAILLVATTVACNRSESDVNARRAADKVGVAAARAGDQLADSWLTTKIQAQYFADDDIKARHINVSTRDGVVTLTGYVDDQPQRQLAVQIAKLTDGVRQVNDALAVAGPSKEPAAVATTGTTPPPSTPEAPNAANEPPPSRPAATPPSIDDAQVTARVQSKFFADDRVKGTRIAVETRSGVVTLKGEVADDDERAQALLLARTTEGVQRVEDHLTIAPYVPPDEAAAPAPTRMDDATLTTTIQAKYFVDTTVKASAVKVSVKDGVVMLEGTVPTAAARKQALAIAQNTEGVVQVVDRLQVKAAKAR